jgi:ribosomal protein S12 methylthiotransferase accessory factor
LGEIPDVTAATDPAILRALVERVGSTGHRVLAADLTTDDLAGLHLYVTKVIIPGFHPLAIGHRHRVLGGRRLGQAPPWASHDAGTEDETCKPAINEAPHPYP